MYPGVPALVPVIDGAHLITEPCTFTGIFDFDHLDRWCNHTITCYRAVGETFPHPYLIRGWKPSAAYPAPRKWYLHEQDYGECWRLLHVYQKVEDQSTNKYQESRRTCREQRQPTQQERWRIMQNTHEMSERYKILLHNFFCSESGERKSFKMF